jgi:S-adenosyl methyltransferase
MAACVAAAAAGMAAAAARGRTVVLRHAGAVLAMMSALDTSVPNMARVYNCWLGGKDHFAADRAEADRLVKLYPPLPALARENRAFLIRAAGWAARRGVGQFIDLGAGLPAFPPVHQAVRAVLPAARVAYVDIDPVVLCHAAALLATDDGVAAVDADLRDPAAVLGHRDLRAVIDPGRPVCVILGAVVHFLAPDAARAVTAGYVSLVAPGSCLVLSCVRFEDEELAKQLAAEYTAATWYNHSPAAIAGFFGGLELAGPGVTEARTWPKRPPAADDRNGHVLAGVGRVPACHCDSARGRPMPDSRVHDVGAMTDSELERARRHLMASLSLALPGSPGREPILLLAQISALDAELAGRAARPAT